MREKLLYEKINRRVSKVVHTQSMTGSARTSNGTPDRYYDGPLRDLWVEYKQFDRVPRDGIVSVAPIPGKKKQPKGHLTTLQLKWLERRHEHGKNAWVIVGLGSDVVLLLDTPTQWSGPIKIESLISNVDDVAYFIEKFCFRG